MNNYKTFQDYFIDFIKFIVFMLSLAWLCSCGLPRQQKIINEISVYRDSVGALTMQLHQLEYPIDSMREAYIDKYPAKAFSLDVAQKVNKAQYKNEESAAYHAMTIKSDELLHEIFPRKIYLETKIMLFQTKIDSLKLELDH